jgi:hypothetical protein
MRRVNALAGGRAPTEVLEALSALRKTGSAPEGRAGDRARELWEEAGRVGCEDDYVRWLRCYLKATGKTLADVMMDVAATEGPYRLDEEEP